MHVVDCVTLIGKYPAGSYLSGRHVDHLHRLNSPKGTPKPPDTDDEAD